MESFNEDADGLFACLLEEPGGDQSVNYEVDQSQNQGALGGQNQSSFGYDDGYGGQADDAVGGGGGGDDGGGMSLGAQFLDLVANTIGNYQPKEDIYQLFFFIKYLIKILRRRR